MLWYYGIRIGVLGFRNILYTDEPLALSCAPAVFLSNLNVTTNFPPTPIFLSYFLDGMTGEMLIKRREREAVSLGQFVKGYTTPNPSSLIRTLLL